MLLLHKLPLSLLNFTADNTLTCDIANKYTELPCVCNSNTLNQNVFVGGVTRNSNVGTEPVITGTNITANTTNLENITISSTRAHLGPYSGAIVNGVPATTTIARTKHCIKHAYALAYVSMTGDEARSDWDCLMSPLPSSCPGCCRAGPALVCDVNANPQTDHDAQNPCVCPES